MRFGLLLAAAVLSLSILVWAGQDQEKKNGKLDALPVVYQTDFETDSSLKDWEFTDPSAWALDQMRINGRTNRYLALFRQSQYNPPVRSPVNIALVKDRVVSDFVLQVRVRSTTQDYPHRDLCLFFGYQDAKHFYYVHIARQADPHAHSIFLVNGRPRRSIAKQRTDGFAWDQGWHTVRIERTVADGRIAVFIDDKPEPIMTAEDKTFVWGRVGVGSFDDTGIFDDFVLRGVRVQPPANP